MTGDVQLFAYAEELEDAAPADVARLVADLGCDAIAVAIVYHRGRRFLPRRHRVSALRSTTAYFTPVRGRYGPLAPTPAREELCLGVRELRDACDTAGVGFRAWIVGLHDERLAAEHPEAAARLVDGTPNGIGLCPSAPAAVDYVTALVTDVCAQLRPDSIELEAAFYPAWEPAYTLTLSLEPPSDAATRALAQCFCPSCVSLLGDDAEPFREAALAAVHGGELPSELATARAHGAAALIASAAAAAHTGGATLRVLASGPPEQAAFQGVAGESVAAADRLLTGCGPLEGTQLLQRFAGLRAAAGGGPAAPSLNWTPARSGGGLVQDAAAVAAAGADGLALYNLTLLPERALEDVAGAAAAFRQAA